MARPGSGLGEDATNLHPDGGDGPVVGRRRGLILDRIPGRFLALFVLLCRPPAAILLSEIIAKIGEQRRG